jgi:hypothetical protein
VPTHAPPRTHARTRAHDSQPHPRATAHTTAHARVRLTTAHAHTQVMTSCDPGAAHRDVSIKNKMLYAKLHGYDFEWWVTAYKAPQGQTPRPPIWTKTAFLLDVLAGTEGVSTTHTHTHTTRAHTHTRARARAHTHTHTHTGNGRTLSEAQCMGVSPSSSTLLTSAPREMSNRATLSWFWYAAQCSGVWPSVSLCATESPAQYERPVSPCAWRCNPRDTEEKKTGHQGTLLDDEVVSHEHVAVLAGMNETIVSTLVALGDVRSLLDQQQHALEPQRNDYVRDRSDAQGHSLRMKHDIST